LKGVRTKVISTSVTEIYQQAGIKPSGSLLWELRKSWLWVFLNTVYKELFKTNLTAFPRVGFGNQNLLD
jgi:hypothetical protein